MSAAASSKRWTTTLVAAITTATMVMVMDDDAVAAVASLVGLNRTWYDPSSLKTNPEATTGHLIVGYLGTDLTK
jgi:hypothetical protein